jgi:PAS domain S-box-containing protein
MKSRPIRYRGAILGFMAALLIFMGLFDIFMFRELERIVLDGGEQQTRRELALMGNFTQEALLRNDYVTARQFLSSWVEEHEDIVTLRAIGPNNFVLVNFARPTPEEHVHQFNYNVIYAGRLLISLELSRDFSPVVATLSALRLQMGLRSILLTILLGITLWFILRLLAITPLEREIFRRQQAEKKFRDLLEGAPDGMALVDRNGIISLVNAQMEKMFGFTRPELIGRNIVSLIPERRQERHRRYLESFFLDRDARSGKSPSMEISVTAKDGREFPADISLSPLESEGELYLLMDVRDITARREMEKALQESEQRYRDLVEGTDNLITQINHQGELTFVNHQARKIFGLPPEECLGRSAFDFVHPDDREKTRQALREWIDEKYASATIETRQISITGEVRDLLWTVNLHFDPQGRVISINTIARDITQRKKAEEKIRRSFQLQSAINEILKISLEPLPLEQQLEQMLDILLDVPSLTLEKNGCIYLVEDEPQVLVMKVQRGFAEEALRNCSRLPFGKCLCGKAASLSQVVFAGCLSEIHEIERVDLPQHGHYCIPITSGKRIYGVINLLLKEKHIRDQEEEQFLSSVANTLAGLIERHRTEAEKERLQGQLIESEKLSALGRMTANVAHEIRNPLTAVGGIAKRLDRCLGEETAEKRYTRTIMAESLRLEKILKRVDSFIFDLPLKTEQTELNQLVQDTFTAFATICEQQKIEVSFSLGDLPPLEIDPEKARETLENVIVNAIDSMPNGGSLTIATRREAPQDRAYGVVEVADTGEGIPAENLDTIFEPFFTTKAVGKRHAVGLGLSISKKYMGMHDGLLTVKSKPGEGSTFSLFFPF